MSLNLKKGLRLLRNMSDGSMSPLFCEFVVLMSSARRQLAFDIWWLAFALWLVCIIEVRQFGSLLHPAIFDQDRGLICRKARSTGKIQQLGSMSSISSSNWSQRTVPSA